jgi:hypothetical protein
MTDDRTAIFSAPIDPDRWAPTGKFPKLARAGPRLLLWVVGMRRFVALLSRMQKETPRQATIGFRGLSTIAVFMMITSW